MSSIERIPPGDVIAHISLDACLLTRPRRPMPADMTAWARGLPVPAKFVRRGLQRALREAVRPLWSAWLARFRQGLRIEQESDARVIVHCDTVRYRILADGKVSAEMPRSVGGYEPIPVEVGTPFPSWTWARLIALREPEAVAPLMEAIRTQGPKELGGRNPEACDLRTQALDWLAGVMECLARRCIDGLQMRRRLREALCVDPVLLEVARRARPRSHRNNDVPSNWWNLCLAHREALLELQRIAPALVPLYGELISHGKVEPRRLDWAKFRQTVAVEGLLPAKWRFLMHDPAKPVWQMYREGLIGSLEHLCAFLTDWAKLHDGLPEGVHIPRALWEPLARTFVDPARGHVVPPVVWPVTARATRQAIERYHRAAKVGKGAEFIENEWGPVVRWAANYAQANETTPVRYWGTAKREAADDERRIRARSESLSWPVLVPKLEDGGLYALALANGRELAEEAIAMRHCADRYARRCADGELLIFSLRDVATDRRRASVAIQLGREGVRLAELARSLNRAPDAEEVAFAEKLLEAVSAQVKARAQAKRGLNVPIPPVGPQVFFMERNDSDVYAFIQNTGTGWKGYKYLRLGSVRPISGDEAVETLNPWSWSPMTREDFVGSVEVRMTLRAGSKAGAG
ncbi:hypothetical protein [Arenimonas sp.]|uniref:hypothetical protein n=1 Tax=Arenimonas sp. TaxID=1872635 RepID=UPI0035B13BBC